MGFIFTKMSVFIYLLLRWSWGKNSHILTHTHLKRTVAAAAAVWRPLLITMVPEA